VRYIDSASRQLDDTLYSWLEARLPEATRFACQTGYFRFDALEPFADDVRRMLEAGGRLDLVIGANEERLSAPDLEATLELLDRWIPHQASFTLVGARDGLFHPKTYYVERPGGRRAAVVGSANFTRPGIGHNVEAGLAIDDRDGGELLDRVRDGVLAWPKTASQGSGLARSVTADLIQELTADRVIDPLASPAAGSGSGARSGAGSSFSALGRVPGVPPSSRRRARPRPATGGTRLGRAASPLPPGVVGIVKRLSKTDLKGFGHERGTPYIALPPRADELAGMLPMRPYGLHREPRLDLLVQARLDGAIAAVVGSGTDTTNITHVGMGTTHGSNVDLRFNIQHRVAEALNYVAIQKGVAVPTKGDPVAIELLDGGRLASLTFATAEPLRSALLSTLLPGRAWGWLPGGLVPGW